MMCWGNSPWSPPLRGAPVKSFIRLVPGKLFQLSLMFAGKVGTYPREALYRYSTLG